MNKKIKNLILLTGLTIGFTLFSTNAMEANTKTKKNIAQQNTTQNNKSKKNQLEYYCTTEIQEKLKNNIIKQDYISLSDEKKEEIVDLILTWFFQSKKNLLLFKATRSTMELENGNIFLINNILWKWMHPEIKRSGLENFLVDRYAENIFYDFFKYNDDTDLNMINHYKTKIKDRKKDLEEKFKSDNTLKNEKNEAENEFSTLDILERILEKLKYIKINKNL